MPLHPLLITTAGLVLALGAVLALCITLGGPRWPEPLDSVNAPYAAVDYGGLPEVRYLEAADGALLGHRTYVPAVDVPGRGSVVLVHGSSGSSLGMHPLARALAAAGFAVHALDMRGHGGSGAKGHIAYVGQLEDDVAAFMARVRPVAPVTLMGFSSGGGFALRFAASSRQGLFHSYLLLSPFLGQDAPTAREDGGGWVAVGLPRLIALSLLNAVGVQAFNHLPVLRFGLNEVAQAMLTPEYDYALATNFRPEADYMASLRRAGQPAALVAGADDDLFHADRFEAVVRAAGKDWPVTLLPGVAHIPLTLDTTPIAAIVAAAERLQAPAP
jgi:alpha-beta hydrolase superfamily lysophospholipase